LHGANGTIVRLLEYLVGMANGQFVPNDPAVHGQKQREENRKSFFGFNSNRVKDSNEVFTPNRQNVIAHETVISNPPNQRAKLDGHNKNNVYERSSYDSNNVTQRLEKPDSAIDKINDNLLHSSYTGPLDKIVKTNLKLEEFKILLNRCYPEYQASVLIKIVNYMVVLGDHDSFLDKVLGYLRGEHNVAEPSVDLVDPTLLQALSDKKGDQHISPERYLQGKTKLAAIEQCPKEFVQNVITVLSNQFDITGDLSALDEAFENHRKIQNTITYDIDLFKLETCGIS
jgi:hypothetical protein